MSFKRNLKHYNFGERFTLDLIGKNPYIMLCFDWLTDSFIDWLTLLLLTIQTNKKKSISTAWIAYF